MFIFGFIGFALHVLEILILARCVISFVPQWQRLPVGLIVIALTEPLLKPFRSIARIGGNGIYLDLSPMIALICIQIVSRIIGIF